MTLSLVRRQILVEACVDSVDSARIAQAAGANRIELNLALELDGLTPSSGLVARTIREVSLPVICMARPRSGNFVYSNDEWLTLIEDVEILLSLGVQGIAFGCLTDEKGVDVDRCREIRKLTADRELVFHKAFDDTVDWQTSLDQLVDAGIDRVMTSGHQPTTLQGVERIADLVRRSQGKIEILPAGSVGSSNVEEIVTTSGVDQVHGSFSGRGVGQKLEEIRAVVQQLGNLPR